MERFSERAELLIDLLADVLDRRPKAAKALAAGYSDGKEVYRRLRDADFRQRVVERTRELAGVNVPAAYGALHRICEHGKDTAVVRAAEILLKCAGDLPSTDKALVNIHNTQRDSEPEETLEEAMERVTSERWRAAGLDENEREPDAN